MPRKRFVASFIHVTDFIIQASCPFENDGKAINGVIHAASIYKNMTVTCDPGGKYADFSFRLPRSRRTKYTCCFENVVGPGNARSSVTVLESHSEYTF